MAPERRLKEEWQPEPPILAFPSEISNGNLQTPCKPEATPMKTTTLLAACAGLAIAAPAHAQCDIAPLIAADATPGDQAGAVSHVQSWLRSPRG